MSWFSIRVIQIKPLSFFFPPLSFLSNPPFPLLPSPILIPILGSDGSER